MTTRGPRPAGGRIVVDGEVDEPLTDGPTTGPVSALLDAARPRPQADHGLVHGGLDAYLASIPLTDLRNGELTDGRLVIHGGRTMCWNVKDVVRIEVTVGPRPDSVPAKPPH